VWEKVMHNSCNPSNPFSFMALANFVQRLNGAVVRLLYDPNPELRPRNHGGCTRRINSFFR